MSGKVPRLSKLCKTQHMCSCLLDKVPWLSNQHLLGPTCKQYLKQSYSMQYLKQSYSMRFLIEDKVGDGMGFI
jgi:hypothetical protein